MPFGPPPPAEKPMGAMRLAVLSASREARQGPRDESTAATFIHIQRDGSACLLTVDRQDLDLLLNDGTLVPVKRAPAKGIA
jgi:hypothetical protein